MQELKREILVEKAKELLSAGTVDRVLGWKRGEFDYDVTPALFRTAEEIDADFVWGDFCGANFSKYLVKECGACTVACMSGAMDLRGFTSKQIMAEVDAICK